MKSECRQANPPSASHIALDKKQMSSSKSPRQTSSLFDFIHSRYILSNPYYINQKTLVEKTTSCTWPLGGLAMRQGKVSNQPAGRRLNTLRFTISVNAIPNQPISTIHKSILSRVSLRTLRTDISSKNLHCVKSHR